jgi:hypothetical protein
VPAEEPHATVFGLNGIEVDVCDGPLSAEENQSRTP